MTAAGAACRMRSASGGACRRTAPGAGRHAAAGAARLALIGAAAASAPVDVDLPSCR